MNNKFRNFTSLNLILHNNYFGIRSKSYPWNVNSSNDFQCCFIDCTYISYTKTRFTSSHDQTKFIYEQKI